eukprot:TRINITY_DN6071_c0_g1_i1.p1 TRINITY_DN6071_c0_g1~~TRINITY_DN6071_c0_g1_i1.p1  ORF type:complete len:383 (+),score=138.58 TRINITY_DN6071_c0_g1_i1:167-1315(+)
MSADGDNEAEQVATSAQLEEHVDLLTEKSAETRNISFRFINRQIRHWSPICEEFFDSHIQTVLEAVKKGLKRGSSTEFSLACETATLLCIAIGEESEKIYTELKDILREFLKDPSSENSIRSSAIYALAMTNFLGNEDEIETIETLDLCRDLFESKEGNNELETAALDAYSLLSTTVSDHHIYDTLITRDTLSLVDLLASDAVEVRVSAGQTIALFFEVGRIVEGEEFDLYKFCHYAGIEVNDLLDTLGVLVSDKTRSRGKKDKIRQKEPFKDIVASVEHGEPPSEILHILHQKIEFTSWNQLLQLYAIRKFLTTGLQNHLEFNNFLHEIFDLNIDKARLRTQLTQIEKRKMMSPSSDHAKYRTKNMGIQRDSKGQSLSYDD